MDFSYISVIVCFTAFLVNDIYGFLSWRSMEKRQACSDVGENFDGQGVSIVHKNNYYQIFWLEDTSNLMFIVYGEDIPFDVLQSVTENIIRS